MKSLSSDQRTADDHHFSKKESHEKIIALYYMDYKKQTLIETRININPDRPNPILKSTPKSGK